MIDKEGGFIPARKGEQGVIKRGEGRSSTTSHDGVIKEYYLIDEGDSMDWLDDVIDEVDDGRQYRQPIQKQNNLENQIVNAMNKGLDGAISRVLQHPKLNAILSKKSDWYKDRDYLNVVCSKVVEASNGNLIFEDIKQRIKEIYG